MKIRNLLLGTLLFAGIGAYAHDFTATVNGQHGLANVVTVCQLTTF